MTRLDVRHNRLGGDGEAALRKAIEGRSGFEASTSTTFGTVGPVDSAGPAMIYG